MEEKSNPCDDTTSPGTDVCNKDQRVAIQVIDSDGESGEKIITTLKEMQALKNKAGMTQNEYVILDFKRFVQSWRGAWFEFVDRDGAISATYVHGDKTCGARTAFLVPKPVQKPPVHVRITNHPLEIKSEYSA